MGLLAKTIGIVAMVGAFYAGRNVFPNCPKNKAAEYTTASSLPEVPFAGLEEVQGIIGPHNARVSYLTSARSGLKGYLLTNNTSGEQGILVENVITRKPMYVSLEQRLAASSASPDQHQGSDAETITNLLQRLSRDTIDYFRR